MAQPPGFVDPHNSLLVCKLHKSLYGLKQAPRAWNDRFTTFLPKLGFQNTYSDSSLFVKTVGSQIVILLLYVDDIIITGSATTEIQQVITDLTSEFDIKDLVKRIFKYLKGTMDVGISYSRGDLALHAFSDADWAIFQEIVSRSSTEVEYRALSSTAAELDWIHQILAFLQIPIYAPPVLFCDNLSAIALSFNPVQHQQTKHIEVDVHFVREKVATNKLLVQFVSSKEQFVDILIKGLSASLFCVHCNNLMLRSSKYKIEGG
ncbi:unnamed protein product [Malus baccata var. baccata]